MFSRTKLIVLLAALLSTSSVAANTFIVTSNADSGIGTLREAIGMANANGIAATDSINFNITDTSEAGRTITLQSELPSLSSNIIIDGTTQGGAMLGLSNSKIVLYLDHYTPTPFTFLFIYNASGVEIYGLCFKFFGDPREGGGANYAIYLRNSNNIIVGKPGKGNMFSAVNESVTNIYWNYYNDAVTGVTIQGNVFGLPSFGGQIDFSNAQEITVGGNGTGEGNLFIGSTISIVESPDTSLPFFAKIINNKFNLNWDGTTYYTFLGGSITLNGVNVDNTLQIKTIVTGNIMSGGFPGGISLTQLGHQALIQDNKLSTDITGTICEGDYNTLSIFGCKKAIVGGYTAAEQNILAQGMYTQPRGVHIIKNQFGWITVNGGEQPDDPFVKIITYDNGLITGKANPNAVIQLYTNTCYTSCVNVKYYTTIHADSLGNWSFPYTADMPNLIATSTIADSSTSAFSEPVVDNSNIKITNATCGKGNGSITGIIVSEGTHIRWENSYTGQVIGTDTSLTNVPAGSYVLLVYNGLNGCPWNVDLVVNGISLPGDYTPVTTDASCGKPNGELQLNNPDYTLNYTWLNSNKVPIGSDYFINNLFAGTYYLKASVSSDTSCNKIYGPYEIVNQSGPTIYFDSVKITPASCDNSNGRIMGIVATNVTGIPNISWTDSLNNIVGNTYDLQNVAPGKYRFTFKDAGGCDTIQSPYFTIPDSGLITIDTTAMIVTAGKCAAVSGSIQGIKITGGDTYRWVGASGSTVVGSAADVYNLPPGNYTLTVSNRYGCSKTSPVIAIPQSAFTDIVVTSSVISNAFCAQNTGSVTINTFSSSPVLYTFRWVDSASGQTISASPSISGLAAGNYGLFAKDSNGCEKNIFNAAILSIPPPVINYAASTIINDQCRLGEGGVSLQVTGLNGPTAYTWYDENDKLVGTGPDLQNVLAGSYTVTINDAVVCTIHSEPFLVGNDNNSLTPPVYNDITIPRYSDASLQVINAADGDYGLYFDPAGSSPSQQNADGNFIIHDVSQDTTVYIKRTIGFCSSILVPVHITVIDKSYFAIPNAFTPNGDGLNDKLTVRVVGYIELNYFKIYNQWGKLVFETHRVNDGWDGTVNGQPQNTAVFVWIAEGKDISGKVIKDKGSFVLLQ